MFFSCLTVWRGVESLHTSLSSLLIDFPVIGNYYHNMIKGYLTLKEASEISGINVEALKKRCQEGKIRGALKKGRGWFVPHSEIVINDGGTTDGSLSLLITFVEAAPAGMVKFGVTLFVNGIMISGSLVSRETYLKRLEEDMTTKAISVKGFDGADKFQAKLNETIKLYIDNLLGVNEEGMPAFIHMTDVSVINGMRDHLVLKPANMRIRLGSIDGFMLGKVEQNET